MMSRIMLLVIPLISIFCSAPSWAESAWLFKQAYESKQILDSPFLLFTSANLNANGNKDLIVTDFGQYGNHIEEWKQWAKNYDLYTLKILEWEENELRTKFQKQWDTSKAHSSLDADRIFKAYKAHQMIAWKLGGKVIVETIPPYIGIEWQNGKYKLREQQGSAQKEPLEGSWIFPWISQSCYANFPNKTTWPRECLVGIRDFSGKGEPKLVTIMEDKIKDRQYKQTLRIRNFSAGYPIEWEKASPKRFNWWGEWPTIVPIDRLNMTDSSPLLMTVFQESSWYLFEQDKQINGYRVRDSQIHDPMWLENYDLPDIYLRKTKNKDIEEYWGYRRIDLTKNHTINFMLLLRKIVLKSDLSGFEKEDIDFLHHDNFLGVGFFDLQDIDGDGLDEIILVEETGKVTFGEEIANYSDIKDYIHILKWDGTKYQTMWVSPPYSKRGTKFLVEDIKNTGKKQLVVLSPYGTIQIWEKQ